MERCSKPRWTVAMYLPQPIQDMPSFPTFCLSGRNKKLKASDVESPHRNGCWSGLKKLVDGSRGVKVIWPVPGDCNCSKSSSIARGCRRGWPTAFLSDWATLVRTSMSILPVLAIVGVRWPMQTNWLDWAFICIWWQIYQMERCSNPSLRCISQSHFCLGRQKIQSFWCAVPSNKRWLLLDRKIGQQVYKSAWQQRPRWVQLKVVPSLAAARIQNEKPANLNRGSQTP